MNATAPKQATTTTIEKENGSKPERTVLDQTIEQTIKRESLTWKVADTGEELQLSISHVRKLFANPTKSGKMPTDRDCWLFLQLCKARGLNPYLGDAFLVGYDERDGGAKFSLITSHQALLKRAEASGKKKGMESGVIVRDHKSGELKETPGDFVDDKDTILGGWCKVYRTDYEMPVYDRLKLATFNKGHSRWSADPAGMIVKCVESSAHRLAFPAETGGMYVHEELDGMQHSETATDTKPQKQTVSVADLTRKTTPDDTSQLPPIEPENVSQDESRENQDDQTAAAGAETQTKSATDEEADRVKEFMERKPETPAGPPKGPACVQHLAAIKVFQKSHANLLAAAQDECGYGMKALEDCSEQQLDTIIKKVREKLPKPGERAAKQQTLTK